MEFDEADSLNGALRLICIKHRARAGALLGDLGLHPGQETILLLLDARGAQTQTQLAERAGCEPPSVTMMVRKLEATGLIGRTKSPEDGRAQIVSLTEQGRNLIPSLKERWQLLGQETVQHLGPADVRKLRRSLQALAANLAERPSYGGRP